MYAVGRRGSIHQAVNTAATRQVPSLSSELLNAEGPDLCMECLSPVLFVNLTVAGTRFGKAPGKAGQCIGP
jgi:hypothetical protein